MHGRYFEVHVSIAHVCKFFGIFPRPVLFFVPKHNQATKAPATSRKILLGLH
jgi:hypothetical protein